MYLEELGTIYLELNEFDEAESYLKKALAEGETVQVYNCLGRCAAEKGEYDKAMEYFCQSLHLQPDDAITNYYAGLTYQMQEDYYRVLHHCKKAVTAWPEFSDAYNNIAVCYERLGDDPNAAREYLEKSVGERPAA